MTPDQMRHIATAMVSRRKQWKVRVGIGAVIAAVYFPVTGSMFALGWLIVYGLLQLLESAFHPEGRLARRWGERRFSFACLVLIFVNNAVFGLFGAFEVFGGTMISLVSGPLLLGGAILNAVMVSPASRQVMLAAVSPQILYICLIPFAAIQLGFTTFQAFQVTLAVLLLALAALAAWVRLSKTLLALEDAQAQAEEANRAKSDFLATVSHEIRTPLNGVLGMAQAMAADDLAERQRDRLAIISRSGEALLGIVNDVLDLAKIEARKMEVEVADFDLESLVERAQATFRVIAEAKGLVFETRIDEGALGTWRGDPTRLCQILSNLISNAVKFTETGRVLVTAGVVAGRLRLVVEDTGPGVTAEQLPRLFGKFVQADASTTRKYGGTGLGLSICGELALLMGGSITADHVLPRGLRFTFDVPLVRLDTPRWPILPKAALAEDEVREGDARALRVLAAEDHPVNRQVLTLLLGQAGITPHIVENGEQAVQAWRDGAVDRPWDLILMDVQMPVMDGPTAARLIREAEQAEGRARVPIIALTANVMTHQIEDYRRCGMDDFVAKPIQVDALMAGIEAALARREVTPIRADAA